MFRLFLLFILPFMAGCAALGGNSPEPPAPAELVFTVRAQSMPGVQPFAAARWVILPGNPSLDPSDIIYAEFARTLEGWLRRQGRVLVADPAEANAAVFLIYDHNYTENAFLSTDARPVDIPLAPVDGRERALSYWSPLDAAPGYTADTRKAPRLMLQAVPLERRQGRILAGEPWWTVSACGGNTVFDALRPCIPYLFEALNGLPGRNIPESGSTVCVLLNAAGTGAGPGTAAADGGRP